MKLGILDEKSNCYDPERWCELDALAKGGLRFKKLLGKFLPQNPAENPSIYQQRCAQAHYHSYSGAIINLYVSWLFSASMSPTAFQKSTSEQVESLPPFYGEFSESVCKETTLHQFMRDRFREALTHERSHWLLEKPSNDGQAPENKLDYDARKLGRVTLKAIDRDELFDAGYGEDGTLEYIKLHTLTEDRPSWATPHGASFVETWRIYDAEECVTFVYRYKKSERSKDLDHEVEASGPPVKHGFKRVPFVSMVVPSELCIGEQTRDSQVEHFRLNNGLSWLIRRTCYAQPVWKLADPENAPPQIMGAGREVMIGAEDDFFWTAPPNAPFDILQKSVDSKRDEIYRIVHQMAQGLDNNADTVGRSADSKEIDAAATRILLDAYASFVCPAVEETYEIISEARDEIDYEWSVEGFEGYDTATASTLLGNVASFDSLSIPSHTARRTLYTKVALALLPGVDQKIKDVIREEIRKADLKDVPSLNEAEAQNLIAKAALELAKAKAEPIKAAAATKAASRPAPAAPSSAKQQVKS